LRFFNIHIFARRPPPVPSNIMNAVSSAGSTALGITDAFGLACDRLQASPRRWLVTGAAGFIGSNLVEALVRLGQEVVGVDNFSNGHKENIDDVQQSLGKQSSQFRFIEGDIRDPKMCASACTNVEIVLHQAALGSVPRSIKNPLASHESNTTGFLNMLVAARDAGCARFVYAGSSSTYGDDPTLPKREEVIGRPLSPYAVTKYVGELYASVFTRHYGLSTVGLRYFNVFGPRQDPNGAYAAVIPRWIGARIRGERPVIFGDGKTSRDFCFVQNVIRANLLAATADLNGYQAPVFNVAVGQTSSLLHLLRIIDAALREQGGWMPDDLLEPEFAPFREGDIHNSLADITKAHQVLGYYPSHTLEQGMGLTVRWYLQRFGKSVSAAVPVK
jgi:UDP-N-acetylglucosamine 4-epimerase